MTLQAGCCNVKCNWIASQSQTLEDIIIFQKEDDESTNTDENSQPSISPYGCVMEKKDCVDNDCQLSISARPPQHNYLISAVDVLCTARNLEVYSSDSGYLETSRGLMVQELADRGEDKMLFCLQYSFEKPLAACNLKLKSLQTADKVWFHSVYITLVPGAQLNPFPQLQQTFDMEKVKSLMGGMEVSQGAQSLMATLETQQSRESSSAANLGMMMQMFTQMKMATNQATNQTRSQGQLSTSQGQTSLGHTSQGETSQGQTSQGQTSQGQTSQGQTSQGQTSQEQTSQEQTREEQTNQSQTPNQAVTLQTETQEVHSHTANGIQNQEDNITPKQNGESNNCKTNIESSKTPAIETDIDYNHNGDTSTMERIVKNELGNLEKRLLSKMEGLIKQSEDRICARMAEMLNMKNHGDKLGLD